VNENEIAKLIRQMVRQELAQVCMASVSSNDEQNRASIVRAPTDGPITNLRNVQPYGLVSKAPKNTDCVVTPVNGDITHLNLTGHFNSNPPAIEDGESALYGIGQQVIYMKADGSIHQGILGAASPAVLGDVLQTFCTNVLNAFLNAAEIGSCAVGPVVLDPGIRTILNQELQNHVTTASTNFLSQNNFVDRGAS
jgi:hypothetical protein